MSSSSATFHISDQDGMIQNLRHMLDHLSPAIEQLKVKSKTILSEWQEYNRVLLQMEKILRAAETEIDRVEGNAVNVETYEMCTRKAQVRAKVFFGIFSAIFRVGTFENHGNASIRTRANRLSKQSIVEPL